MVDDPELDEKIQDCCAMGDGLTRDTAPEICMRKEALLKAALEYNALAGQFSQEAIAIDFKIGSHGPFCTPGYPAAAAATTEERGWGPGRGRGGPS